MATINKDKSFDRIIKGKLEGAPLPDAAPDWAWMRDRLATEMQNISEEEAASFDRLIRRKAPKTHDAGLSQNWASLVTRLDKIYLRERRILSTKILELAVLLLILLLVDTHSPWSSAPENVSLAHAPTGMPVEQVSSEGIPLIPGTPTDSSVAFSPKTTISDVASQSRPNTDNLALTKLHQLPALRSLWHGALASASCPDVALKDVDSQVLAEPLFANSAHNIALLPSQQPAEVRALHTAQEDMLQALAQMQLLPSPANFSEKEWRNPYRGSTLGGGKILPLRKGSHLMLSMYGGPEVNYIITPEAIADDRNPIVLPARRTYSPGYCGGLGLAWGKGRWELETGIIYTAKQYHARRVFYLTGSVTKGFFGEGITDIEMNIVAVPLTFRYDLSNRRGWRTYAGIGITGQTVLESNFAIAGQEAFRSSKFNPDPAAFENPGVEKRSGLKNKDLSGGLLQGGGFADNTFFTTTASIGLERHFLRGWSFFVQPSYHYSFLYLLHGLGPDNERLHTFSVYSGVRVRL